MQPHDDKTKKEMYFADQMQKSKITKKYPKIEKKQTDSDDLDNDAHECEKKPIKESAK
jgi:hypothetical protein